MQIALLINIKILNIDWLIIFSKNEPGTHSHLRRTKKTRQTKIHRCLNTKKVLSILFRLLSFRVFITPANGINTELAKNLILAGVNVSIYDDAIITPDDF